MHLIQGIMGFLRIERPLILSSSLSARGQKTDLIVAQCKEIGADVQLAGNGSKSYIDKNSFEQQGIRLVFQDFCHPVYTQSKGQFTANLSAIDYLFHNGAKPW
jgi:hypothetical protein